MLYSLVLLVRRATIYLIAPFWACRSSIRSSIRASRMLEISIGSQLGKREFDGFCTSESATWRISDVLDKEFVLLSMLVSPFKPR